MTIRIGIGKKIKYVLFYCIFVSIYVNINGHEGKKCTSATTRVVIQLKLDYYHPSKKYTNAQIRI